MDWLKEQLDDLVLEFNNGGSAADIAKALSGKFHQEITRNAVLGKLNRMKLTRQRVVAPSDKPKPLKPRRSRMVTINKPRSPPPKFEPRWEVEPPEIFRCSIYQLNKNRCHWPYGDNPPFTYCGAAVTERGYCYFHYQRTLRKN